MQREDNWFERVNFPIGIEGGGNTGHCPTENLVESYEMQASGLPVAPDAGYEHMDTSYDSQNPYEGRDPRMYELVAQNGAWWVYDEQVECWYGRKKWKATKKCNGYRILLKKICRRKHQFEKRIRDKQTTCMEYYALQRDLVKFCGSYG